MFEFDFINQKKILKSDLLQDSKAKHFFTTRETVVTPKEMEELQNLCSENLSDIASYLNVPVENIITPVQTHSDNIAIARINKNHPQNYQNTDALIVDEPNIAILLNFADCTPVILYDEKHNIGAIAHAGWKGTASSIVAKTIAMMSELYFTNPKDITAIIGPAISMKNYQVDKPVFDEIKKTLNREYTDYYLFDEKINKYNIDLKTVNQHQLEELGVLRIDKSDYCTYDSIDVFFSYRKEHGKTARHSAVLKLNN